MKPTKRAISQEATLDAAAAFRLHGLGYTVAGNEHSLTRHHLPVTGPDGRPYVVVIAGTHLHLYRLVATLDLQPHDDADDDTTSTPTPRR